MSQTQRKILKSSVGVACSTLLSRALGLLRVVLEARILGGGALATAWNLAFTLPNLFRSILGEGALGNALIPIITHAEVERGRDEVRRQLAVIFVALGAILAIIVTVVSAGALCITPFLEEGYWRKALLFTPLVMPYGFFMCLVGISQAVLNTRKVFFLPSLGNLLLNVMEISCLALILFAVGGDYSLLQQNGDRVLYYLGVTVLISGLVHLLLMTFLLYHYQVWPDFHLRALQSAKVLKELFTLALPGLIAGSAVQISFVVDRTLAGCLSAYAVPALSYTERLVYLPIGVFALSLGMVLMSNLSHAAAEKRYDELCANVAWGLRYVQFVGIPLAAFIILFRYPILTLLFKGGAFDETCLKETAWATLFYALGIPSFCSIKVILTAFYSRKDTRTPLRCSLISIGTNVVLNLILMWPLQQGGIALATVCSSTLNNTLLLRHLHRDGFAIDLRSVTVSLCRALPAALLPGVALSYSYDFFYRHLQIPHMPAELAPLLVTGTLFALAYVTLSHLLGAHEGREVLGLLRRRRGDA